MCIRDSDSTIAENTVDVSKEEDEKKVSTYKDNLTKALGTIKADADVYKRQALSSDWQIQ